MTSSSPLASLPDLGAGARLGRAAGAVLDRLEEWLIATLVAAATAIVFVAVLHRYGTSSAIDTAKWLEAHGLAFAAPPLRALFSWLAARDLSWAQELCIYLFIWMAKFGAAYGVRTGIHVGVDVLVKRMDPAQGRKVILGGLLAGALFTATIANFGVHFTAGVWESGSRSNDLEAPMWIVYLAIPLGSALMCFRFLQAAWQFWRHGTLAHHDAGHVDGVATAEEPPPPLQADAPAAGAAGRGVVLSWVVILLPFALLGIGLLAKYGIVHAGGGLRAAVVFGLLLSLMLTGMPISIALGLTVLSFMFLLTDVSLDSVAMKLFTGIENFEIMAIPFFILAGNFLTHGGVARRMIDFATSLVGHWHGGLGLSAVLACALFAAVSGSSPATVVAIGSVLMPAMVAQGYPPRFGAGVVTTSGALGILIPPSIAMVLYSVSTNTSVGKLFIAGIVPGLLLATMLGLTTWYRAWRFGYPRMARAPWSERVRTGRDSLWGLMLIIIVIGGIYTGIFTPTEAAAVSAVYAFVIAVFVYKDMKLLEVPRVLLASASMSAMLLYIITNAVLFSFLMTSEQIPQAMAAWMVQQGLGSVGFLLVVNVILLLAGNVMEPSSIILIMAPILFPVAMKLGIDPIHFGILITVNMEVGLCHPPVGLNLYVASGIARMGITELTVAVLPWLVTMLVFLGLVTYLPEISLLLPRLLRM
jgi:C4-dicarboxylate transporter DctM subunit